MASARLASAAASGGEAFLYAVGGRFRGWTLRSCERLPLAALESGWQAEAKLLEHRGSLGLAACGSRLLAVAGGGLRSNLATCEVLDAAAPLEHRSWRDAPPLVEEARHALSCAQAGNTVYAVGGWQFGAEGSSGLESCGFDPATSTFTPWKSLAPLAVARRLHGAAFVAGRLFVFGGALGHAPGRWGTSSVESYDPLEDRWEAIGSLPFEGRTCAAAVGETTAMVFVQGGSGRGGCFRFQPGAVGGPLFEAAAPLPLEAWHGMSATSLGTDAFLVGGTSAGRWTRAAWRYCSLSDSWHELPAMTTPRRRAAVAVALVPAAA